ncbi:MAG TPA: hypothetical protein V6D29_22550 [Leptolyngbyaceae cyanobacterium]
MVWLIDSSSAVAVAISPLVPVTEQLRLESGLKDDVPVVQNPHSLVPPDL